MTQAYILKVAFYRQTYDDVLKEISKLMNLNVEYVKADKIIKTHHDDVANLRLIIFQT